MLFSRRTLSGREVLATEIEVTYNRLNRAAEQGVFDACWRQNLGVLAREPLANGYLSGRYRPGTITDAADWRSAMDEGEVRNRLNTVEQIRAIELPAEVPMELGARMVPAESRRPFRRHRNQVRRATRILRRSHRFDPLQPDPADYRGDWPVEPALTATVDGKSADSNRHPLLMKWARVGRRLHEHAAAWRVGCRHGDGARRPPSRPIVRGATEAAQPWAPRHTFP
jgi:hypothetical protein